MPLILLILSLFLFSSCDEANGVSTNQSSDSHNASNTPGSSTPDLSVSSDAEDPWAEARIECVNTINEYRATEGLPPYERWVEGEACADDQAAYDMASGSAHDGFRDKICTDADPRAQNECPGYRSLNSVLTTCLAQMWAEGPGEPFSEHGHYINMSATKYSKVACGFAANSSGSNFWAVQNFK